MYPEDNIFVLYRRLDKRVPFRVRRLHMVPPGKTIDDFRNSDRNAYVVTKVQPYKAYGSAYGYHVVNQQDTLRDNNSLIDISPNSKSEGIPCAGCGGWILIDQKDLEYIANRPKCGPDYILNFGQYKGKSLKEVFIENPSYIKWVMHEEIINIDMDSLSKIVK